MVDVEERALAALEQDDLARVEGVIEHERGVGDVGSQRLGVLQQLLGDGIDLELTAVEDLDEDLVLVGERTLDLLPQDRGIEEVLHSDAEPTHLVHVRRPDAAARRTDLGLAQEALGHLVERDVIGRDEVRTRADEEA